MAEDNNKNKKNVAPGLVKSEGYTKPQKNGVKNPTLKVIVTDLPSTQKLELYSHYYEEKKADTNWIPPQSELHITEEMRKQVPLSSVEKTNAKQLEEKTQPKFSKPKKREDVPVVEAPKVADKLTSDMELALQNMAKIKEQKEEIKHIDREIPMDVKFETETETPKINMFEAVNQATPEPEQKEEVDKKEILKEKPYMRIDKSEVRTSTDADGNVVYMVDRKVYKQSEFSEYLQGVSGKILARDCKFLEIKGVEYKLKGENYLASTGETVSVDEMLDLLAQEK